MQELEDLLGEVQADLGGISDRIDWAEDEIRQAQARHPRQADRLFHAFGLLSPGDNEKFGREFAVRSHCRELLERVAAGRDTRPGTDAEMVIAISYATTLAPMTTPGAGLYFRLWHRAGFPDLGADNRAHYEALEWGPMNKLERDLRQKMAKKDRVLGSVKCAGVHHAKPVNCRFAAGEGGARQ